MSLYDPYYLSQNLTKQQLRDKYKELYEVAFIHFENKTDYMLRVLQLENELLKLYRKLYSEDHVDDELNVDTKMKEHQLNSLIEDVNQMKIAIKTITDAK